MLPAPRPTLFDGPGRESREDLDWLAHSFLAHTPLTADTRRVIPLIGFSWDFTIRNGQQQIQEPTILDHHDWSDHLGFLRTSYPDRIFAEMIVG